MDVVVFRLGPQQFGIPVEQVAQVFPVAEIAPISDARAPVRGAVSVHGKVTPVVDLGRRIADAWTPLGLEQQFIYVNGPTRHLVLLADEVEGVRFVPDDAVASAGFIYVDDVLATELPAR
jgi:purine-binding chemotaxis protein CheW